MQYVGHFMQYVTIQYLLCLPLLGCTNGQIRLMDGSEPSNGSKGRVEICYNNVYGTICDDLWDESAARVACGGRGGKTILLVFHTQVSFTLCGKVLH